VNWLTESFEQYSLAWLLLSAFLGGVIGTGTKFLFEDVLRPRLGWRREANRALRDIGIALMRSANTLERQINNQIRNSPKGWYTSSDYYRLSTLYTFAEYFALAELIEHRYRNIAVESSKSGRRFLDRLTGPYKALTSFAYFRWCDDKEAVGASAIPRRMITAMGEAMLAHNGDSGSVRTFTQFCLMYETEPQFRRWFAELDALLRRTSGPTIDVISWDRLIAAGAHLRALVLELGGHKQIGAPSEVANLDRLSDRRVLEALERDLPRLVPPSHPARP
jgi:hypothetical protein